MEAHVGRRRHGVGEVGDKGHTAHFLQLFFLAQFLGQRDEVDGLAAPDQLFHRREDDLVRLAVEVIGPQDFLHFRDGFLADEHGAEH